MNNSRHGTPLVFISYRSHDEPSTAYLLFRELNDRFGDGAAFRDCDSIAAGMDFEPEILDAVRGSAVVLVVIGADWLRTADGRRALDEPDDWVRREIVEASAQGIRVVPVLVGDAPLPAATELPDPIQGMLRLQYMPIRHRHERDDINALIDELVAREPRLLVHDHAAAEPSRWAGRPPARVDAAAELLAAQVFQQASDAVQAWRLDSPKVVTSWRFETADSPRRTWRSGAAHSVAELARMLRDLPRKRLAILGEGGCGKTSLATLLIRQLAAHHNTGDRVPVLVPLAGWDPDAESPHTWLTRRLVKDYPALRAAEFGRDAARTLVRQRRVLPVLDGLDELPLPTQRRVMRVLSQLTDEDAWIVTSRTEAFTSLPATHRAGADATMTAQPLSAAEAHAYLHRTVRDDERWRPVLAALTDEPGAPLATALHTPLTLWLVSQTYLDTQADPARLTGFTDPEQLRHHLLAELVPSVLATRGRGDAPFPPSHRWPADRAHRWLANLARFLAVHGTTELAWWRLADLGPRSARGVLVAVLAVGAVLLAGGAGFVTAGGRTLVPAMAITLVAAIAGMGCSRARPAPAFASFQLYGRIRRLFGHLVEGVVAGLLLGGLLFLGARVARWLAPGYFPPLTPVVAAVIGIGVGLGVGFFRWAGVPTPLAEARTPAMVLRADRRLTLLVAGILAVVLCVFTTYAVSTTLPPAGLAMGLAMFPVWLTWAAFGVMTPGAHRLTGYAWPGYVLTVTWAAASGRLPWRLTPFLADMHRLGILKQVGAVYQFRHTDVRDILAKTPRHQGV